MPDLATKFEIDGGLGLSDQVETILAGTGQLDYEEYRALWSAVHGADKEVKNQIISKLTQGVETLEAEIYKDGSREPDVIEISESYAEDEDKVKKNHLLLFQDKSEHTPFDRSAHPYVLGTIASRLAARKIVLDSKPLVELETKSKPAEAAIVIEEAPELIAAEVAPDVVDNEHIPIAAPNIPNLENDGGKSLEKKTPVTVVTRAVFDSDGNKAVYESRMGDPATIIAPSGWVTHKVVEGLADREGKANAEGVAKIAQGQHVDANGHQIFWDKDSVAEYQKLLNEKRVEAGMPDEINEIRGLGGEVVEMPDSAVEPEVAADTAAIMSHAKEEEANPLEAISGASPNAALGETSSPLDVQIDVPSTTPGSIHTQAVDVGNPLESNDDASNLLHSVIDTPSEEQLPVQATEPVAAAHLAEADASTQPEATLAEPQPAVNVSGSETHMPSALTQEESSADLVTDNISTSALESIGTDTQQSPDSNRAEEEYVPPPLELISEEKANIEGKAETSDEAMPESQAGVMQTAEYPLAESHEADKANAMERAESVEAPQVPPSVDAAQAVQIEGEDVNSQSAPVEMGNVDRGWWASMVGNLPWNKPKNKRDQRDHMVGLTGQSNPASNDIFAIQADLEAKKEAKKADDNINNQEIAA